MILNRIKKHLSFFIILMLVFVQASFIFDTSNIVKAQSTNSSVGLFTSPEYQINFVSFDDVLVIKYETNAYQDMELSPITFSIHSHGGAVDAASRIGAPLQGRINGQNRDMVSWIAELDLATYNLDKNLTYDIKAEVYHKTLYIDDGFNFISIKDNGDEVGDEPALEEPILKLYNYSDGDVVTQNGVLLGAASVELFGGEYFMFEAETGVYSFMIPARLTEWAELEEFGILEEDHPDTPYPYRGAANYKDKLEEIKALNTDVFNLSFKKTYYPSNAPYFEIYSNKVAVKIDIDPPGSNDEPKSDGYSINIYSNDDIKTNNSILASLGPNFENRILPKVIFQEISTMKIYAPVSMSYISCDSLGFSSEEIRGRLEESGHALCFRAVVPPKGTKVKGQNFIDGKYNFWIEAEQQIPNADVSGYRQAIFKSAVKSTRITFLEKSSEGIMDGDGNILIIGEDKIDSVANISPSNKGEVDCEEFGLYDDLKCQRLKALIGGQLDHYCVDANIYEVEACEEHLRLKQVELACQKENISNIEECKDFMLEKYVDTVECAMDDKVLCRSILRDKYLNRLVMAKERQAKIASTTRSIFGQTLSLGELKIKMQENEVETEIVPLVVDEETNVYILKSGERTVLESAEQLTVRNNMIIVLDNDKDGLSDDAEKYYGTDPQKIDSDGDGFSDLEEIKNGYNPIGDGLFNQFMSNLDIIMTTGRDLEQPKAFSVDLQDEELSLDLLSDDSGSKNIKLSGTAKPNTWVNIFLYSDLPLVMTAKADASGNWKYDIQNSLVDGSHKVYVTVNDDTGNIVKQASPISFLVKSAQAVTADQYFQTEDNIIGAEYSMLWIYILGAIFLIVFGLVFIFLLHHQNKKEI